MDATRFSAGEVIFLEGSVGRKLYVLVEGKVELRKKVSDGEQVLAVVEKKNEIFGEMSLLDDQPRSASAFAITDVAVIEVDDSRFENLVTTNGAFAWRIIQILTDRIRGSNKRIVELTESDDKDRFLWALVEFALKSGEEIFSGGRKVQIDDARSWINLHIGMSVHDIDANFFRLIKSNMTPYAATATKTHDAVVLSPEFIKAHERTSTRKQ